MVFQYVNNKWIIIIVIKKYYEKIIRLKYTLRKETNDNLIKRSTPSQLIASHQVFSLKFRPRVSISAKSWRNPKVASQQFHPPPATSAFFVSQEFLRPKDFSLKSRLRYEFSQVSRDILKKLTRAHVPHIARGCDRMYEMEHWNTRKFPRSSISSPDRKEVERLEGGEISTSFHP